MPYFIDRRLNPKDKSLGNRQRFLRRARAQIKEAVNKALKNRNVSDTLSGETISIPTKGIAEPRFRLSPTGGNRDRIFPGNKEFDAGDRLPKPPKGGGEGRGKKGADQGDGTDEFEFALSRDEFLDLFFEDLELPELVKTTLKEIENIKPQRAGIGTTGTPTNINVIRTMRMAMGRRLALKRPRTHEVLEVERQVFALENKSTLAPDEHEALAALRAELKELKRRQKGVPYIDPLDIRYNQFVQKPEPSTKAVMFCLMDVSGSMGEREKDLAKRFFVLLHLFLKRRYERIEVVFIRHTHQAQEVDEETFFYSRETGGTVVSTALREMLTIVRDRYSPGEWNIYAAQASDGDNFAGDAEKCTALLSQELMPMCQYYAYVEILDEREMELFRNSEEGAALWRCYRSVAADWQNFAMKRIATPADIYPVFRELFAKQPS